MQHSATIPPRPPERLATGGDGDHRRPDPSVRDGDLMRMVAAMAGPTGRLTPYVASTVESDAQYYRRRSTEEGRAAVAAANPRAREKHRELAARYARLSREKLRLQGLTARNGRAAARAPLASILAERFGLASANAPGRAGIQPPIHYPHPAIMTARPLATALSGRSAIRVGTPALSSIRRARSAV